MILLASKSPRRKAILKFIGIPFRPIGTSRVLEMKKRSETAREMARRLALEKALAVSKEFPSYWVLGADTIVVQGKRIFGKPKNHEAAKRMLMNLQGRTHMVMTGVAFVGPGAQKKHTHVEITKVSFKRFKAAEIKTYLNSKEPYDKAGAYNIQGTARHWIRELEGDYFNVLGLPIRWVIKQTNLLAKNSTV